MITAVDGQPVRDFEDLTTYLARYGKVGQSVNLTILRNGNVQSVTLTLAARPAEAAAAQTPGQQQGGQNDQGNQGNQGNQGQTAPRSGVYLGVTGMTVTPEIAQAMDLGNREGVLVVEVSPNSPAEKAGLKGSTEPVDIGGQQMMVGGDVITAVDGKAITTVEELVAAVRARQAGDTLALTIVRDGQEQSVNATLANRGAAGQPGAAPQATPETQPSPAPETTPQQGGSTNRTPAAGSPWLGISGIAVTNEIAQLLGLGDARGVLVMNVVQGSPAEKAGLKGAGLGLGQSQSQGNFVNADVITAVNGAAVTSMDELASEIQRAKVGDTVNVTVLRNGESQELPVTLAARPQ